MSIIRDILKYPFAHRIGYELLRHHVKLCHWLMGIGAGGDLNESGEKHIVRKLRRKSKCKRLLIFDVGANKGQFLKLILKELSEHIEAIHSFEPALESFNTLKTIQKENGSIKLNRCAVSDKPGTAELYYDKAGSELASLTKRDLSFKDRSFNEHEKVNVIKLDDYCKEQDVRYIDWLKIDVEGHELNVLKGGIEMIKNGKVGLITIEFGGANIDTRTFFRDFYNFFRSTSMIIHRITPGGYIHPIKKYREREEQFVTMNLAIFPPPKK